MKFSEKIKNIRLLQGMTQEEFSCFLGIGYASVQKYESGIRNPSYTALGIICGRFPEYTLDLVIDDISTKQIYIKQKEEKA
ncbi:hypothetical protein BSPLISOX_1312 [uncultured Gammaproteobacteria bacterium]|jgi:transcriptional regulator with XRE-family HTH domain|nr:hypothetical protein BSPLISOX_1312 [uncultured Gammaproteobacteria bacterium]